MSVSKKDNKSKRKKKSNIVSNLNSNINSENNVNSDIETNTQSNNDNAILNIKIKKEEITADIKKDEITADIKKEEKETEIKSEDKISRFCNKYNDLDSLKQYDIDFLERIYKDGNYMLNVLYEMNETDHLKIMKLQYVISNIMHVLENKRYEKNTIDSDQIRAQIEKTSALSTKIKKEFRKTEREIEKIKNEFNSILATIISIILSISVISSAVVGIENIDPNYIIPFVSSIMFFGMIMIIFIFSIYKNKIPKRAWLFLVCVSIITIFLWISSINSWINISKNEKIEISSDDKARI